MDDSGFQFGCLRAQLSPPIMCLSVPPRVLWGIKEIHCTVPKEFVSVEVGQGKYPAHTHVSVGNQQKTAHETAIHLI